MNTETQEHPAFVGKSPEEVALDFTPAGDVEAFDRQVAVLRRTLTMEYQDRLHRFFEAYKAICVERDKARYAEERGKGRKEIEPLVCSDGVVAEALSEWLWTATLYDFDLSDEDVKRVEWQYGPWNVLKPDRAPWPTKNWFRFAQTNWFGVQWDIVPDFPAAMLAMAGYKLASASRYMGDLTDDQVGELMLLQWLFTQRKANIDQKVALNVLFEQCPYGGELPVFDIDAKVAKGLDAKGRAEAERRNGEIAVKYALGISAFWRDYTGAEISWTVTNRKGGLHGRHARLVPSVRSPYLLRKIAKDLRAAANKYGLGLLDPTVKIEDRDEDVYFDIGGTYEKDPGGRGGMWRLPGCRKPDSDSLPQSPIENHLHEMPWLRPLVDKKHMTEESRG